MTPEALAPPVVAELLRAAAAAVGAELSALPAPVLAWHPADGEWCVKEVLGHLIETEQRGFAGRIRIILGGDRPQLEGWDQEAVARARNDCARDWAALHDEFARLRASSVALVAELEPADLSRGGRHPKVGVLTVGDLLHEWVHHDRNHIRQMLANVQAFAWPHMGNAQRFSLPTPS
ncbi:MAG TPA: DinB family protein [Methylomirabilota bacterium]|nr:DinB family protein [Methylomirabilota bacterium]